MPYSPDDRVQVRRQLAVLAKSTTFAAASQLANLLAYLVAAELNDTGHELNQTRIAVDVLGRRADFDAATDAIVRVEAGRLRTKLREYYGAEGAEDQIRFDVPKGRYSPKIQLGVSHPPATAQQIRFLKSPDGTSLAYAVSGKGMQLVKAANWLSHLEFDHQSPVWLHWWRELSARYELIRYDERGSGLSDWDVDFGFESWLEDLEAVIDQAVAGRCVLLGISQSVAVAIAYAVKHPERVSHLILYGGFAQGHSTWSKEVVETIRGLIRIGWGSDHPIFRKVFASLFLPEGTPEQFDSFDALQRVSTSPENAEKFFATFYSLDVLELASRIKVPTLVLHAKDDLMVAATQARLLATTIPSARLVLLESRNHILCEAEPAWPRFLQEIQSFVTE